MTSLLFKVWQKSPIWERFYQCIHCMCCDIYSTMNLNGIWKKISLLGPALPGWPKSVDNVCLTCCQISGVRRNLSLESRKTAMTRDIRSSLTLFICLCFQTVTLIQNEQHSFKLIVTLVVWGDVVDYLKSYSMLCDIIMTWSHDSLYGPHVITPCIKALKMYSVRIRITMKFSLIVLMAFILEKWTRKNKTISILPLAMSNIINWIVCSTEH